MTLPAELTISAASAKDFPLTALPEIALVGRSNVGKSSLINALLKQRIARTSAAPGKTRLANYYLIDKSLYLVDLPGYGYARIAKSRKAEWLPLIEGYLRQATALRGVVQLLDVRHAASSDDLQMLDFLADVGVPTIVALTKIDKLRPHELPVRMRELALQLQLDEEQMIPFSATTNAGRDDLAAAVVSLVEQPSWRGEATGAATGDDENRE